MVSDSDRLLVQLAIYGIIAAMPFLFVLWALWRMGTAQFEIASALRSLPAVAASNAPSRRLPVEPVAVVEPARHAPAIKAPGDWSTTRNAIIAVCVLAFIAWLMFGFPGTR